MGKTLVCSPEVWLLFWSLFPSFTDARRRPYLYAYKHSDEVEEVSIISLTGVNVESNSDMEALLGVHIMSSLSMVSCH